MQTLYKVRTVNKERYLECIRLRKQGLSYKEIREKIPVAKSTLQNWLTLAGLTLTEEHQIIQHTKYKENYISNTSVATRASVISRAKRSEIIISAMIQRLKICFNEPLFVIGVMLYEAEGAKGNGGVKFSNSDYKLVRAYLKFISKYFFCNKDLKFKYRLAIHDSRSDDLNRILRFWRKKLKITSEEIHITWKHNVVTHKRKNLDYVGQMEVTVLGEPLLTRKLLVLSDIILKPYTR